MTEVKDDPREVLALLNSLGFVGITAPQLKAFMKDLKLYRKIKERERQQWKEKVTNKILTKQESMMKDMLRDTIAASRSSSVINVSETDISNHEDPVVRIKVHCVSEDEENEDSNIQKNFSIQTPKAQTVISPKIDRLCRQPNQVTVGNSPAMVKKTKSQSSEQITEKQKVPLKKLSPKSGTQKRISQVPARPMSAPNFVNEANEGPRERTRSVASDSTGQAQRIDPSRCTTRSSTKSFIRPWKLQAESQRNLNAKKSDPVALYHKYQQEWKQISFPGEEHHAKLRWAIREKMLGMDPNPKPILKKSQSLVSIRKR